MSRIIIGIHGLGNKPPERILKRWWKKSIYEGLKAAGHPHFYFKFEMVYWADLLYPEPLNPREKDKNSLRYLDDPYVPADDFADYTPSELRKKINRYIKDQIDRIFLNSDKTLNLSKLSDIIIHRYFRDLEIYYQADPPEESNGQGAVRDAIRARLAKVLKKHRRKEVLLVAHSMGSIIAYDVLTELDHEIKVHTFATIGSPLGLPIVMSKIYSEQREKLREIDFVKAPENVHHNWFNFADLEDKVAFDYELAGDFMPNTYNVGVQDFQIYNNYKNEFGKRNPHKSFGYLRAKPFSEKVHEFLGQNKISRFFNQFFRGKSEPENESGVNVI